MSDPRFARLQTDPRFKRPKATKHKLVLDDRFAFLLDGSGDGDGASAHRAPKVDKYGRKRGKAASENELKRYYRLEQQPAEEEPDAAPTKDDPAPDYARGEGLVESSDEEGSESSSGSESDDDDDDDDGPVTLAPVTLQRRLSRSPSIDLSETEFAAHDDDSGSGYSASDAGNDEGTEKDEAPSPTRRLAVVNMDWDHLRARDLYHVLASPLSLTASGQMASGSVKIPKKTTFNADGDDVLKGTGKLQIIRGRLLKLVIYQSEFGRSRIEREEREGPPKEVFIKDRGDGAHDEEGVLRLGQMKTRVSGTKSRRRGKRRAGLGSSEEDESSEDEITEKDLVREQLQDGQEDYDGEALRKYQLERLRYYYAIATFDSPASAQHVHSQINNTEFERTANILDLQFVPENTTFHDSPVHDEATEASILAEGSSYEGVDFVTDALRHSKVQLTWDADDPHRKSKITSFLAAATDKTKASKGKKKELNEDDVKVYLASSSSEASDGEPDDFFEEEPSGTIKKRSKLRDLFGLDNKGGASASWDGGSKTSKSGEGDMQITFAPALTDSRDAETKAKTLSQGLEEETALETYKRKEKERRERKRAERKARKNGVALAPEGEDGPEFGGEDTGPGGFDDDFFQDDAADADVWDRDRDFSATTDPNTEKKEKKLSKTEKRKLKESQTREVQQSQAELALLVDDEGEGGEDGSRHFDMRKIIKAEKGKGKKTRAGKGKSDDVGDGTQDGFRIDVGDERFKSLHEDYEFAIDPSNPRFQKTRNMEALLAEGRKRRAKDRKSRPPVAAASGPLRSKALNEGQSLQSLVASVKRKAGDTGGRGKRVKAD